MTNANIFSNRDQHDRRHRTQASPEQIRDGIRQSFVDAICTAVADQHLTHAEAAAIGQTPRTSLTAILNGKLDRVSMDRLLNIAVRLGATVHVRISQPNCLKF